MSCFHPKTAYMHWIPEQSKYYVDFHKSHDIANGWEKVSVPCGKCVGCHSAGADQWAVRCQLEAALYPGRCWFVTLTYDDAFLHFADCARVDLDTGEVLELVPCPTLFKRDWQLFEKQVRNTYGVGMRFLACGEYGEQSGRPHYHAVLMNIDVDDLKRFSFSNGNVYYTSDTLSRLWSKGHVLVAPYAYQTGSYVAKYMTKSQMKLDPDLVDCREPPKLIMSRRPGLARQFYDDNRDHLLEFDRVVLPGENGHGAYTKTTPHYFDYLFRKCDGDDLMKSLDNKKHRRELAAHHESFVESVADKPRHLRLLDQEASILHRKQIRRF